MNSALLSRLPEHMRSEFSSDLQLEARMPSASGGHGFGVGAANGVGAGLVGAGLVGAGLVGAGLVGAIAARPLGVEALDSMLPDEGLPRGQVTELAVSAHGGLYAGLGTSIGLWACRAAQRDSNWEGAVPWCAFLDPEGTLYAPGVAAAGVQLDRLLVLRPNPESLQRVALKLAESRVFSVIVIDTLRNQFAPQFSESQLSESQFSESQLYSKPQLNSQSRSGAAYPKKAPSWERAVRRLSIAIQGTGVQVVLLTDLMAPRPVALPVALRLELTHSRPGRLSLRVTKDKRGRVGAEHWVPVLVPDGIGRAQPQNTAQAHAAQSKERRMEAAPLPLAGTVKRTVPPFPQSKPLAQI